MYIENMDWILNISKPSAKASLSTCYLKFTLAMLVNFAKSCNYYHHRVTISTRGTEIICLHNIVSWGQGYIYRCISPMYTFLTIHLNQGNETMLNIRNIGISCKFFFKKWACFDSCFLFAVWANLKNASLIPNIRRRVLI